VRAGLLFSALVAAATACGQCGACDAPKAEAPPPKPNLVAQVPPALQDQWEPVPPRVAEAMKLRAAEPRKALELLDRAWEEALDAGDARTAGMALHRSGDLSHDLLEFRASHEFYARALGLYELAGEKKLTGIVANDLGILARVSGDDPVLWFGYAVNMRRDAGDARGLRTSLGNLGARMLVRGQHRQCMPILEESLRLAEEGGDVEGARKAHINLAGAWVLLANDTSGPRWVSDGGLGPRSTAFNHLRAAMELGARLGMDGYRAACQDLVVEARSMCSHLGTGAQTVPEEEGEELDAGADE
jgi:tetratricopeptide (TPR) repeat protein